MNAGLLKRLFSYLQSIHYVWGPLTPDRLIEARRNPAHFAIRAQLLGLGLGIAQTSVEEIFPNELYAELQNAGFLFSKEANGESLVFSRYAVSGFSDLFVLHDHWPPKVGLETSFVHVGHESTTLARIIQSELEAFISKSVLDLGCSSGILSLEVAGVAKRVCGIDLCEPATRLATTTASAYGFLNTEFIAESVLDPNLLEHVRRAYWDRVIFNPPMVVPAEVPYPHRDGGKYGIEIPLKFFDFALAALKLGGELFCLCTNPIVKGK
ncbi:MAG TPA: methyltransferase, partial [Oligoflexia bacterium]|nr:methyltransferase [Oligoflexia bacterium]